MCDPQPKILQPLLQDTVYSSLTQAPQHPDQQDDKHPALSDSNISLDQDLLNKTKGIDLTEPHSTNTSNNKTSQQQGYLSQENNQYQTDKNQIEKDECMETCDRQSRKETGRDCDFGNEQKDGRDCEFENELKDDQQQQPLIYGTKANADQMQDFRRADSCENIDRNNLGIELSGDRNLGCVEKVRTEQKEDQFNVQQIYMENINNDQMNDSCSFENLEKSQRKSLVRDDDGGDNFGYFDDEESSEERGGQQNNGEKEQQQQQQQQQQGSQQEYWSEHSDDEDDEDEFDDDRGIGFKPVHILDAQTTVQKLTERQNKFLGNLIIKEVPSPGKDSQYIQNRVQQLFKQEKYLFNDENQNDVVDLCVVSDEDDDHQEFPDQINKNQNFIKIKTEKGSPTNHENNNTEKQVNYNYNKQELNQEEAGLVGCSKFLMRSSPQKDNKKFNKKFTSDYMNDEELQAFLNEFETDGAMSYQEQIFISQKLSKENNNCENDVDSNQEKKSEQQNKVAQEVGEGTGVYSLSKGSRELSENSESGKRGDGNDERENSCSYRSKEEKFNLTPTQQNAKKRASLRPNEDLKAPQLDDENNDEEEEMDDEGRVDSHSVEMAGDVNDFFEEEAELSDEENEMSEDELDEYLAAVEREEKENVGGFIYQENSDGGMEEEEELNAEEVAKLHHEWQMGRDQAIENAIFKGIKEGFRKGAGSKRMYFADDNKQDDYEYDIEETKRRRIAQENRGDENDDDQSFIDDDDDDDNRDEFQEAENKQNYDEFIDDDNVRTKTDFNGSQKSRNGNSLLGSQFKTGFVLNDFNRNKESSISPQKLTQFRENDFDEKDFQRKENKNIINITQKQKYYQQMFAGDKRIQKQSKINQNQLEIGCGEIEQLNNSKNVAQIIRKPQNSINNNYQQLQENNQGNVKNQNRQFKQMQKMGVNNVNRYRSNQIDFKNKNNVKSQPQLLNILQQSKKVDQNNSGVLQRPFLGSLLQEINQKNKEKQKQNLQ